MRNHRPVMKIDVMDFEITPPPRTVLLLQSDAAVAARLKSEINAVRGLRVVGAVNSLAQARAFLDSHTPDLLVGDLRLADGDVTSLLHTQRSRGRSGPPKLLVVSLSSDDDLLTEAMRAGADGYFIQGGTLTQFLDTLTEVLLGVAHMTPTIARALRQHFAQQRGEPHHAFFRAANHPLWANDGELRLLDRLAEGYILSELAREQGCSEVELGLALRRIYRKVQLDVCMRSLAQDGSAGAETADDAPAIRGWFQPAGGAVSTKLGRDNILAAKRAN